MIPEFPNFAPLKVSHIPYIRTMTDPHPEYSDFNALSLLAWNTNEDTLVSNLHGNLVVMFRDYMDGSRFLSLFGRNTISASVEALLRYADECKVQPELRLVPEETVAKLGNNTAYTILPDRDNFDYVIGLQRLCETYGSQYRKFRRDITHFKRYHEKSAQYIDLNLQNNSDVDAIRSVFLKRESGKITNDERAELMAMNKLVSLHDQFSLFVRGITVKGTLQAYVIYELNKTHTVEHFCKGNTEYMGINQYLFLKSCTELVANGHTRMNIEQDLGIPGLRLNKLSLDPVCFRRKYTITGKVPRLAAARQEHRQLALKLQHS